MGSESAGRGARGCPGSTWGFHKWVLREAGRDQTPLGSSEIQVLLITAQSLKLCRAQTGIGALQGTVLACPQPLGQPRGSPSFGTAPRRWVLQGLEAVPLCRAGLAGILGSPGAGHSRPAGPRSSEATETGAASSAAKRRGKKRSGHRSEGRRKNTQEATAPWFMCEHIHYRASDPKMGQKKVSGRGRVRVRISHLLVAVGQVPGCVQPCPHDIQLKDPQAGWGSEDRREFPSQGQPHWCETHGSCRGIPASHSTNSALR